MMNIWPEVNDIKLPTLNRSGFAISNLRHFIPVIEISKNHQLKTSRPFDGLGWLFSRANNKWKESQLSNLDSCQ